MGDRAPERTPEETLVHRRTVRKIAALPAMVVSALIAGIYMGGTLVLAIVALMHGSQLGWIALLGGAAAFVFNSFFIVGSILAWVVEPNGFDALLVAIRQPDYPPWLRPFVALWWLLHWAFAMILALSLMLEHPQFGVEVVLFSSIMAFGLAYASYSYLLMTVTVFTKAPSVLKKAWMWRSTWAACHGVMSIAIALAIEWLH